MSGGDCPNCPPGKRAGTKTGAQTMHWILARFHGDQVDMRASWSVIYIFEMTRLEYAAELILTAAVPSVISSSIAQLSDMSAIRPLTRERRVSDQKDKLSGGRR